MNNYIQPPVGVATKQQSNTGQGWNQKVKNQFSDSMSQSQGGQDEDFISASHTVSKSLTDLAELPVPVKKTVPVFNDDGFDDWNFENVEDSTPSKSAAAPPADKEKKKEEKKLESGKST